MEEWVSIRELARQGVSVSEISRRTGRDRKTVRKVLAEIGPKLHANASKKRGSKLEPFREYLLQRIDQGCLNGVVLLEEITKLGYIGKITVLRELLTPIRKELVRKREATERFETGPGKQGQVDWGDFGKIWDGSQERWRRLHAFLFTLGYSRAQYLEFVTSCDLEHFLSCHLGAFEALGIPETLLYDNLKAAILGRRVDGTPIFPGRFLDFALYYGFTPKFCQPYQARTKGKVERGISYVRQNFWVRVVGEVVGKELTLAQLNERARDWVEGIANRRVHGTHGEVVLTRYAEEEPLLGKVDARPRYDTDYHSIRRVGRDGRLSYRGRFYQVALKHALGEVQVSENLAGQVTIRSEEGHLLRAELVESGGATISWVSSPRQAREVAPSGDGDRRRVIHLRGLAEPEVETRDLAVYEEVARAANAS